MFWRLSSIFSMLCVRPRILTIMHGVERLFKMKDYSLSTRHIAAFPFDVQLTRMALAYIVGGVCICACYVYVRVR